MGFGLVGFAPHDIDAAAIGFPSGNAGSKMLVGVSDALVIFLAILVFVNRSKSTRLNSSHVRISYAVFCLKKKKKEDERKHPLLLYSLEHHTAAGYGSDHE